MRANRLPPAVADAIADGWDVNWADVEARSVPATVRSHLDALRLVERRARQHRLVDDTTRHTGGASPWMRALVGLGVVKVCAASVAVAVGPHAGVTASAPLPAFIYLALAWALVASGMFLLARNQGDRRVAALGAVFVVGGASYASEAFGRAIAMVPASVAPWAELLGATREEAFIPALLWLFVQGFPAVPAHVVPQRLAPFMVRASIACGAGLVAANLALHVSPAWAWLQVFDAQSPNGLFVLVVYGLTMLCLPALVWKAAYAHADERRRAVIFVLGLAAGIAPTVAVAALGSVWPSLDQFVSHHLASVSLVLYAFLLTTPVTTGYAVIVERVLEVRALAGQTLRYLLAKTSLALLVVVPLAAAGAAAYAHRHLTLAELASQGTVRWLLAMAGVGLGAAALRTPLMAAVDRAFFRHDADHPALIERFAMVCRQSRSLEDLERALSACGASAFAAERAVLLWSPGHRLDFVPVSGAARPLAHDAVVVGALEHVGSALLCNLESLTSPVHLLPRDERQWLVDHDIGIIGAISNQQGTAIGLVGFARKRSGLAYEDEDRAFVAALTAAASAIVGDASPGWRLHGSETAGADPRGDAGQAVECRGCGGVFRADVTRCPRGCSAALIPAAVPWLAFGKFRVEARIGAGGMGVVYRATDISLDRPVALKTLPLVSPEGARRLRNEARAMAAIQHPNLAVVYAVETWRGTPVLVVEYLPGGTLADRLRGRPLTTGEMLRLGRVLADVLQALHASALVHRDIKPSNIAFDASGTPKLLDFGLSYLLDVAPLDGTEGASSDAWLDVSRSRASAMSVWGCGTPLYVAPDVIDGAAPSPAMDLWSVAVVLYESIAGRHPFAGATVRDVVERIRRGEVPDVRTFSPACPEPVAAFLATALSRDRLARPADAGVLRAHLDHLTATIEP